MSVQVSQKAPGFKMQGIFKGEIRDSHLEGLERAADRGAMSC